jgi:phage shock protein A
MGIFKRVQDIVASNVNDLLDRAENPEKMIKQVIREMEDAVEAARKYAAQALASQKKLQKEIETNKRMREEWRNKASEAVTAGRDDLARLALTRKREYEAMNESLQSQFDSGQVSCDNLKRTLRALQAKLADAKRKQLMLVARQRAAQAEIAAQSKLSGIASKSKAAAFGKFARMEEAVDDLEIQAETLKDINSEAAEIEAEFEALSGEKDEIDAELAELKKKVKGRKTRG